VTYELPTDKIKDGSFKAFALTPDLYDGIDAQSKEINAARNKREKGMQEFTPNDLAGITEAVNVNIDKASANFSSYLEMDPIKARAVLSNSIYPEKTKKEIDSLMNNLQAGGIKGATAQIEVREELKKDIEYKWGMNTGVFRNDKNEFEVMKPEEKEKEGNGYKFAAEYTDAEMKKKVDQLIADIPESKVKGDADGSIDKVASVIKLLSISDGMEALSGPKYQVNITKGTDTITITEVDPSDNIDKVETFDVTNVASLTNLILRTQGYGVKNKAQARKIANKIAAQY
jgi:hypothetical protein